jgi:hypothetical protein
VTISGLDPGGNRFTQSASTIEIGANGLRLRSVRCLHQPGQAVHVDYRGRHASYRVSWIGAPGTCWESMVGLEIVEGDRLIFADHLLAIPSSIGAETDSFKSAQQASVCPDHGAAERRDQEERRRHPRCSCAGGARIWENGMEHAVAARLNEISMGGCYLEIMSPMRIGTALRMELEIGGRTLHVEGIVRTSHPMMGMGIEFTRMKAVEAEKLHRMVGELGGEVAPASTTEPASDGLPRIAVNSASEVGEAVLSWFGVHETLTRQEFLKLVEQTQRATGGLARV